MILKLFNMILKYSTLPNLFTKISIFGRYFYFGYNSG